MHSRSKTKTLTYTNNTSVITKMMATVGLLGFILAPSTAFMQTTEETSNAPVSVEELTEALKNSGLPVGDITVSQDGDDTGVVIYLPQYHRYPGSQVGDARNNPGQAAQEDLYAIIESVLEKTDVDLVFVEGEHAGPVDTAERDLIGQRVASLNQFKQFIEKAPNVLGSRMSEGELNALLTEANKTVAYMDRAIILEGAPEKLWAEGRGIELYGTENPETKQKSAELVRERIYLQDQIKKLSSGASLVSSLPQLFELMPSSIMEQLMAAKSSRTTMDSTSLKTMLLQKMMTNSGSGNTSAMKQMLMARMGKTSQGTEVAHNPEKGVATLDKLEATFAGDSEASEFIKGFEDAWKELVSGPAKATRSETAQASFLPSRSANPFASVTDKSKLSSLMKQNTQKMNEIVVEQRNRETAEEVASKMTEKHESLSILQYGAGHEEGLVEALRDENLTVITVVPETVQEGRESGR